MPMLKHRRQSSFKETAFSTLLDHNTMKTRYTFNVRHHLNRQCRSHIPNIPMWNNFCQRTRTGKVSDVLNPRFITMCNGPKYETRQHRKFTLYCQCSSRCYNVTSVSKLWWSSWLACVQIEGIGEIPTCDPPNHREKKTRGDESIKHEKLEMPNRQIIKKLLRKPVIAEEAV